MAYPAHIRGILLEEALLFLLAKSGYRTVQIDDVLTDPTLQHGSAGIEVKGRGADHQIDAIADFVIAHPFSNPQRLLVEAKCYSRKAVGLDIIRSAVGVLKDVSEHWITVGPHVTSSKQRYHYQFAVFSASGYTSDAEKFAFAQDIYLIPLLNSPFISQLIDIIFRITSNSFHSFTATTSRSILESQTAVSSDASININPTAFRTAVRNALNSLPREYPTLDVILDTNTKAYRYVQEFIQECQQIGWAPLAMLNNQFPLLLVPARGLRPHDIDNVTYVRIRWDEEGWYLDSNRDKRLFSFDLPSILFEQYAEQGLLTPRGALYLKENELSKIQAIIIDNDHPRVLTFRLDREWLDRVKENLYRPQRRPMRDEEISNYMPQQERVS